MSLKKLKEIADTSNVKGWGPLLPITIFFSFITTEGIIRTRDNWRLRDYYNQTVLHYGDINGNGMIEEDEDNAFREELNKEIRNEPGFESFTWREKTHISYNHNAKDLLNLLKKYKPIK